MASDTDAAVLTEQSWPYEGTGFSEGTRKQSIKVNDVVIEIATVNGSGSQSANLVLARAIFQMGVPVGAKNIFPSNIQGLPTWFTIRVNKNGWVARRPDPDLMVCMNPASVDDDLASLKPGAVVILREDLTGHLKRKDLKLISVPFTRLVKEACEISRLRRLVVNMMYVGVLAHLIGIDIQEVHRVLDKLFGRKAIALEINAKAVNAAYQWASQNYEPLSSLRIERMQADGEKIMIEGNRAMALGAIWGGVTLTAWYPITPSSSVAEGIIEYARKFRHDPETDKATYAVVQAEDELAAMAMVVGAGWVGARAMTATSGPGISLMAELAGLAYFAEIPAVIVDVQRMGPSTGLPTRTCQNDIMKAYYLSHGDCKHLLLIPGTMQECFEFTCESFNYAERFQTLVLVMSDLDLGMNIWMSPPLEPPTEPIRRGKVLDAEDLERLGGFKRYADVDGDGIPYRTLPGVNHPAGAYYTRGTGHTEAATYSEKQEHWVANIDRLARKFETARRELPPPIIHTPPGAHFGLIACGSSDPAVREAIAMLAERHAMAVDYLRIRALPPHPQVLTFIEQYDRVYVIDQNRDSQMNAILRAEFPLIANRMLSVRHYDGMAIDARSIVDQIVSQEIGPQGENPT